MLFYRPLIVDSQEKSRSKPEVLEPSVNNRPLIPVTLIYILLM